MTWPMLFIVLLCLTGNAVLAQDLEDWFTPRQLTEEQQRLIDTSPLGSFENPVRAEGPVGQRAYLARLRCSSGEPPEFFRGGSYGAGPYGTILDGYRVTCTGAESVTVFMDLYHAGFGRAGTNLPPGALGCRPVQARRVPAGLRGHGRCVPPTPGGNEILVAYGVVAYCEFEHSVEQHPPAA